MLINFDHMHDDGPEERFSRMVRAIVTMLESGELCDDCFIAYSSDLDRLLNEYMKLTGVMPYTPGGPLYERENTAFADGVIILGDELKKHDTEPQL